MRGRNGRIRGQIEQTKGKLRWMRDRVARATIYVTVFSKADDEKEPVVNAEAKFFPGIRLGSLHDLRSDDSAAHLGGGLVIRLSRHFSIDVEGYRSFDSETSQPDVFLATLGGELYSDRLGAGRRRWFNPYLGLRAGYVHIRSKDEFAAGGTVGVEIYKTKTLTVEADTRVFGVFGAGSKAHAIIQPAASTTVAF